MLTDKQYKIYEVIKDFINKNGYSPSIREICKLSGKSSPATVFTHLKTLKDKEYISYVEGKNRTIRVIK